MVKQLPLAQNKKQWFYITFALTLLFFINTLYEYSKYTTFKSDEIFISDAKVVNIYPKRYYQIIKLKTNNFTFFTANKTDLELEIGNNINLYINTTKITFLEYLKGFYATSFNMRILLATTTLKQSLSAIISNQHQNNNISNLFNALFFATPINKELREICAVFGVSHLVAISGFHLGILSLVLYFILHLFYSKIHSSYFPYRNKKFDILIVVSGILFTYLLFTNIVPSLLRAFVMLIFGIFLLRTNIKVLSFGTLALVVMFIVAIFPRLLFSLSLWFSVAGVFYIFLFIQYFKDMNKILAFFIFNVWIYLAINPITHFFFGTTSLAQLYSPLFTIGFTLFYPIELFLHLIGMGGLFDNFIEFWLNLNLNSKEVFTPTWVFISYLIVSFLSIPCPKWFRTLNLSFIAFNLWLYLY